MSAAVPWLSVPVHVAAWSSAGDAVPWLSVPVHVAAWSSAGDAVPWLSVPVHVAAAVVVPSAPSATKSQPVAQLSPAPGAPLQSISAEPATTKYPSIASTGTLSVSSVHVTAVAPVI